MGYYSDVAVHMPKDTYTEMLKVFDEGENIPRAARYLFDSAEVSDYINEVVLYWGTVKWYKTFEDVDFIMTLLDNLNKDHYNWCLLRSGEDETDVEYIVSDEYDWDYAHTPYMRISWQCKVKKQWHCEVENFIFWCTKLVGTKENIRYSI